jgi:regulatory protein
VSSDTYVTALRMLARRELSEAQLRQRLARRQHTPEAIDAAVARLIADRSLDDTRVAGAIARSETHLKKRGRLRVRRTIEAAGISPAIARQTLDEVFESIDADALLSAALARRLRGRERPADQREFERLVRYLVGQGFDVDQVLARLASLRPEPGP